MGRLLLAADAPTSTAGVITALAALLVAIYPLYKGWSARRNSSANVANSETDRALKASGELNERLSAEISRLEKRVKGLERQVRQLRRDDLEDA